MNNWKKIGLLILALSVVALYIIIYVVPRVTGVLQKTEIVHYGEINVSQEMTYYILRNEKVYLSEKTGDINYYYEEGSQVRKGTRILEITPNKQPEEDNYQELFDRLKDTGVSTRNFTSEAHGLVSYYMDGYEGYFTPESISQLRRQDVVPLKLEPTNITRKGVRAGEPLYKICDHTQWYIIGWVEKGEVSKFNTGTLVTVEMPKGSVRATIEEVRADGDWWLIVMKTNRYYEEFTKNRTGLARVVTANSTGILVSNDSITTNEEGQIGVYVRKKDGDFVFTPVKVINSDGTYSAVEASYFYDDQRKEINTIDVYDEIRRNAGNR